MRPARRLVVAGTGAPPIGRVAAAALAAVLATALAPARAQAPGQGPATTPAPADAVPPGGAAGKPEHARALERCEASVVETLQKLRGKAAQDVQFTPAQRVVAPADEDEIGVKGAGRYRGPGGPGSAAAGNSFSFSCTFNFRTGLTSAVVLREAGRNAATAPAFQPDMSRLSPEACESAVARALKARHPRVARIALEPDTRRLEPGPDSRVLLLGQGAVQRAEGMNAEPFNYACELDPRNGRVLGVKTSV